MNYHKDINFFLQEEELKTAILVVLANKQDIEGAMSVTEVRYKINSIKTGGNGNIVLNNL